MFSFHKPRVYRSLTGCCICKAKSSSSRFTDSRKYENDFQDCFQLSSPRQGEICNACVLLVKRFKRLPAGSERHWGHVVDARAGPGMKCMSKFKKKRDELLSASGLIEKQGKSKDSFETCTVIKKICSTNDQDMKFDRESSSGLSEESWGSEEECIVSDEECSPPPILHQTTSRMRRKGYVPMKCNSLSNDLAGFLDSSYWKRETVCCGVVWKGPNSEILLNARFFKPCEVHQTPANVSTKDADIPLGKLFSDNSSDSGYDESSNPMQMLASRSVKGYGDPTDGKESLQIELFEARHSINVSGLMNSHCSVTMHKRNPMKQQAIILKQHIADGNKAVCAMMELSQITN